jgi:hypothetical protein
MHMDTVLHPFDVVLVGPAAEDVDLVSSLSERS